MPINMKKLTFLLLLLPIFASGQNGVKPFIYKEFYNRLDTNLRAGSGCYTLDLPWNPPPPITVRIYVGDDDPVQTLIDALKKAGVIVERVEWNYEKKYSDYLIKKYW